MHLYFSRSPLLAVVQVLFFLDSGSLTCCSLCLKESPSSVHSSGNSYLPSRQCHLLPETSMGPCSQSPLLAALLPTGQAVCGSKQPESPLRPYSTPHSLPVLDHVPGTWDPGSLCPSDPRPLLGLDKAWLDRPPPWVSLPRVAYTTAVCA